MYKLKLSETLHCYVNIAREKVSDQQPLITRRLLLMHTQWPLLQPMGGG